MFKIKFAMGMAASLLLILSSIYCAGDKSGQTEVATETAMLTPAEDARATREAFEKAESTEEKNRIIAAFFERNPNNQHTINAVELLAVQYYLTELNDPDGAIAFAQERLASLQDPKLVARGDLVVIRLLGEIGKKDELRKFTAETQSRRKLTLEDHHVIAEAAIRAEDWETAYRQSGTVLGKNTPEIIRAEAGDANLSDEQVQSILSKNQGMAHISMGRALLNMGDSEKAVDHFESAGQLSKYNFVGFPNYPFSSLNIYWAEALLKNGNARAAADKVAIEAAIMQEKDATEVFKRAYLAAGGSEDSFAGYVEEARQKAAKTMPDFFAYNYEGKKVYFNDLKGKVTLLTFWSPT